MTKDSAKKTAFVGARLTEKQSIALKTTATMLKAPVSKVVTVAIEQFCADSPAAGADQFRHRAEAIATLGAIRSDARKAGGLLALAVRRANGVDVVSLEENRKRVLQLADEAQQAIRTLLTWQ